MRIKPIIQGICILSILIGCAMPSYAAIPPDRDSIDAPEAREITESFRFPINGDTTKIMSHVSLRSGDFIDMYSAERLLGKVVSISDPIHLGSAYIAHQIKFENGTITTTNEIIRVIRVFDSTNSGKEMGPFIANGFACIGWSENDIRKEHGNPTDVMEFKGSRTLVYANGKNYIHIDINPKTGKVISYELGLGI